MDELQNTIVDNAEPDDDGGGHGRPVALVGYARKRDPRGVRRLYERPDSAAYVEIKVDDIVGPPAKGPDLQPGEIVIWVRGDAKVSLAEVEVRHLLAQGRSRWPRR